MAVTQRLTALEPVSTKDEASYLPACSRDNQLQRNLGVRSRTIVIWALSLSSHRRSDQSFGLGGA
jgi:hypothetical protein